MKLCDTHTHSNNSFDAQNSVEEMCQSAIKKGLYAIAITDHCEAPLIRYGAESKFGYFDKLIPKSNYETRIAKEKYASEIKVLCGLELGEPMHDSECTKKALSYGEYDFVIGSVHNLRNMEDFYYLDYKNVNVNDILDKYFDELTEAAMFNDINVLAHLTYPLRYIKRDMGIIPDLSPYQDKIDNIYKILIKNNKALEINVSGLHNGLGTTLPDKQQIKRYKELGGELITIGSDAHCCADVARNVKEGIELAKKCGFTRYVIFENKQAVFIDIE